MLRVKMTTGGEVTFPLWGCRARAFGLVASPAVVEGRPRGDARIPYWDIASVEGSLREVRDLAAMIEEVEHVQAP